MVSLIDTSVFKKLLGDRIDYFASTSLHVSEQSIKSMEINMLIACKRNYILFECDYKFGFFENENGDVFYDYKIGLGAFMNTLSGKSTVTFNTSEIIQIDIYGRDFKDKEFIPYPDVYQKVKGVKTTDDLFFFNCRKGERLMMVFHPFMPGIEVFYKQVWIDSFWNQYGNRYKLHCTVK